MIITAPVAISAGLVFISARRFDKGLPHFGITGDTGESSARTPAALILVREDTL